MEHTNGARRLSPDERKAQILDYAVSLAVEAGYRNIKGTEVAKGAGLQSHGLISHYFGTTEQLRQAVMDRAIETENLEIILQGIVSRDSKAMTVPEELKQKALLKLACE
jgi:AcrR family transcriptional regulator